MVLYTQSKRKEVPDEKGNFKEDISLQLLFYKNLLFIVVKIIKDKWKEQRELKE